jgi:hypothetical protein
LVERSVFRQISRGGLSGFSISEPWLLALYIEGKLWGVAQCQQEAGAVGRRQKWRSCRSLAIQPPPQRNAATGNGATWLLSVVTKLLALAYLKMEPYLRTCSIYFQVPKGHSSDVFTPDECDRSALVLQASLTKSRCLIGHV